MPNLDEVREAVAEELERQAEYVRTGRDVYVFLVARSTSPEKAGDRRVVRRLGDPMAVLGELRVNERVLAAALAQADLAALAPQENPEGG